MGNGSRFSPEVKEQAVRLVFEQVKDNGPNQPAILTAAARIECTAETIRRWVRQVERKTGEREGLTTDEREELKRENRELKKANEILR